MSSAVLNTHFVIQEIEPVLVTHYRNETGKSPTLYEFKQYIVSQAAEKLLDALKNSDSSILKSLSAKEALAAVNLYIRKIRVS